MYPQSTKVHQKLISFPEGLYELAKKRIKHYGISFSEYVRLSIIKDIEESDDYVEILDKKTSEEVEASLKDYRAGRFVTLKSNKEIEDYFNNLK
jgi:hypothetical protein